MSVHHVSRRSFLQSVAGAAVAAPFLSRDIRAAQTVRHASIGSSGQAFSDIMSFAEHPAFDLVAVADVDLCKVDQVLVKFPKVRVYQDWRELLKKERDHIDSVSVSTPDHMHCMVAVEALRRNKPVYVQKPLCNTLHEVRQLTDLARKRGLTTQMGIQVSSSKDSATAKRWSEAASSGRSRKSHVLEQELGRRPAAGRSRGCGATDARLGSVARRRGDATLQARRLPPRRVAQARWLWHRNARRHGVPHLQPALSRAGADITDRRHGLGPRQARRTGQSARR
jgi:hypothetical protein